MANVYVVDEDEKKDVPEVNHYRIGTLVDQHVQDTDVFQKPAEDVKSLSGLTPVFKRKITNELKKVQANAEGSAGTKQLDLSAVTAYNAFEVVAVPYNMDYLARLYEMSPYHKAAVDAKVANIVGLGWDLKETSKAKLRLEEMADATGGADKVKKARKTMQRAKETLKELIEGLNADETLTEVLRKVWQDYEVLGNGYLEVSRKKNGEIGYIGHIPAGSIRVRRARDGFVQMISNKAVFFRNFGDKKTSNPFGSDGKPNELIHIMKPSPTSSYYGVPDIIAATQAIAGNEFAARFNLDYFSNKAVPRHVVILKGATLATSTENALLSFFETGLKGQNHRTLYIPLPSGTKDNPVDLKIEPIEAGIQDSSFNNYTKRNRDEILFAHRVPLSKIGVAEGVSLAVARDADKTFKEQVCGPEQTIFEKKLNRIIKEFTDAFELSLNEMTLTDADTQSKIDERDIKNQIKTPNEVRADRGMAGLKGGDKVVDLKPQQRAEATTNRQRDAERSANATDSAGEGRNPKGEGRTTP